jgi:hypothetical protein
VRSGLLALVVCASCKFAPHLGVDDANAQTDTAASDSGPMIDAAADGSVDAAFVCSDTGLACPNAVSTAAITCNNACWVKCQSSTAFTDVDVLEQNCAAWGGKLAPLRDANDQSCVDAKLFKAQASYIGFRQAANQALPALGWSWNSDNKTPTFIHWSIGQPDDGAGVENGDEQCAFMTTNGDWQDVKCLGTQLFRYSCKHEP